MNNRKDDYSRNTTSTDEVYIFPNFKVIITFKQILISDNY